MSATGTAETAKRAKVALSSVILAMTLAGVVVAGIAMVIQTVAEKDIGPASALGTVVGGVGGLLMPVDPRPARPWIARVGRFVLGAFIGGPAGALTAAPRASATLVVGGGILILLALVVRWLSARRPNARRGDAQG